MNITLNSSTPELSAFTQWFYDQGHNVGVHHGATIIDGCRINENQDAKDQFMWLLSQFEVER
jgi:hypothetical protein